MEGHARRRWLLLAVALLLAAGLVEPWNSDLSNLFSWDGVLAWILQSHAYSTLTAILLFGSLYFLTGKFWATLISVECVYSLIGVASSTKKYYLGVPLTLADVRFFASNFLENIQLFNSYPWLVVAALSAAATLGFLIGLVYRAESNCYSIRHRTGMLMASFATVIVLQYVVQAREVGAAIHRVDNLPAEAQDSVVREAFMEMDKPAEFAGTGKSLDLVETFLKEHSVRFSYPSRYGQADVPSQWAPTARVPDSSGNFPDIMVVLHESLFNPKLLQACEAVSECESSLFQESRKGRYGPLAVHIRGGGTWLSEFALLSGFDWRVFGPGGAYAPLNVVPNLRAPLPKYLKALGYRTVAVYPVGGNFLNARQAYRDYGFDEFYAVEDLGISSSWQKTSDSVIFEKTLQIVGRTKSEAPTFVFVLTIRNHGPHGDGPGKSDLAPEKENLLPPTLADYLSRMRDTEIAMKMLEKAWLENGKRRVLAWFGDHQPHFALKLPINNEYFARLLPSVKDAEMARMITWHYLARNFDAIDMQAGGATIMPTDIAYLGIEILNQAGLPLPPHGNATLDLSKNCPLGIVGCAKSDIVGRYLSYRVWQLGEIW